MHQVTTVGMDLAKNVMHVVCCDHRGEVVARRKLKRQEVLGFFAQLPVCVVAMEACAGAHHWARQLQQLGHDARLLPAQYVKAYLRGNKNDYNDALAIAEAAVRPQLRTVAVKTGAQQDVQALQRLRAQCVSQRTALANQLRGLLGEYGIVLPKGLAALRRAIPALLEDAENRLSGVFRQLLAGGYRQLGELDAHVAAYTRLVVQRSQASAACRRLQKIPGFGPIVASAFEAHFGDGRAYRRGRDASSSIGVVPRQHSSGDKAVLLSISKRGDRYLRSLVVHGARAVVSRADGKDDPLSRWIQRIKAERGFNKAVVALANKLTRIGWAILAHGSEYQASKAAAG